MSRQNVDLWIGVRSTVVGMAAVINFLQFKEKPDPELFQRAAQELGPRMSMIDGFENLQVVQSGDIEVILLIFAETIEALDRIAAEIGSPWMVANVVPYLAGPPQRHIGPVIASTSA